MSPGAHTEQYDQDMSLAVAPKGGPTLPLAGAAAGLYSYAMEEAPEIGNKDFSSIYKVLEVWSRRPYAEVLGGGEKGGAE